MSTPPKQPKKSEQPLAKTVLAIDDDSTTLAIIKQALSKAGYSVLIAESGEAGLKIAREDNPDVIITDVLMPDIDGFMLFKELKREAMTRSKPVLVLTSRQNLGDTFRRFGADSFLTKPVDPKQLVVAIEKLLNK